MRVDNLNEWIPLGEVVAKQGEIPKEIIEQLVLAMKEFRRVSDSKKADALYVFATEGMRIARNHDAVIKKILKETGVVVEIISPARESELSLSGVQLDTRNIGATMLFEVGGGSAQIGILEGMKFVNRASLPLGTGRIIAESGIKNPCPGYALQAATKYVRDQLAKLEFTHRGGIAVISGGVGRGLWRALHPDGDKHLHRFEVEYLLNSVSKLPLDRIGSRFNVKSKRAGTLLPGAIVYSALMDHFELEEAVVSEFGVREGAILEMASGKIKV